MRLVRILKLAADVLRFRLFWQPWRSSWPRTNPRSKHGWSWSELISSGGFHHKAAFFQSSLFLFTACLSVWSFLTYPLLAACMAEQWTDKLRNPSVRGSGRQGNWPDTLPSAIHSTFLPQPCPNPTTPPPLPSASPPRPLPLLAPSSEIFHPAHPTPMQLPEVS